MKYCRSHTCGELRTSHIGQTVTVMGWVNSRRDHGGVIFIDLRDRYGLTQVVADQNSSQTILAAAQNVKDEFVLAAVGKVRQRPGDTVNPELATGEIEVEIQEIEILSEAKTPPFPIFRDQDVNEDVRLTYRYLDLRRARMQRNMLIRHRAGKATREYLNSQSFIDIETPFLMKRTPEGARDYLVPSRLYWGQFYALPQSPQIYKQLLMLAGFDRYYQLVRCFRDEDLRADRQPEFTQIDIETSFLQQSQILDLVEGLVAHIFKETIGYEAPVPFLRMTYKEAMDRFGSDKPDMRFGMEFVNLTEIAATSGFKVFADAVQNKGQVKAIKVAGGATMARARLDKLTDTAKSFGAKGLVWIKCEEGGLNSPIVKFLGDDEKAAMTRLTGAAAGDLLLIVADQPAVTANVLGRLRLELGKELNLIDKTQFKFLWVTQFPLLEWDAEEKRWNAMHHPFTSPFEEDIPLFDTDPGAIRAQAYDLVLNGTELGGGSVRIHRHDLQTKMFDALGMTREEAKDKFGFLLEAFEYGAPPHGGLALGFDRLVAILANEDNIRQVIAFPKTNRAQSLMDGSPAIVEAKLLSELGLAIKARPEKKEGLK